MSSAGFHAVGGADGGVERGVGVAQAVFAGRFERFVKFAQRPAVVLHDFMAQGAQGHARHRPRRGFFSSVGDCGHGNVSNTVSEV